MRGCILTRWPRRQGHRAYRAVHAKILGRSSQQIRHPRQSPINGHATQDEDEKEWLVQPVAVTHQQVVSANYTKERQFYGHPRRLS